MADTNSAARSGFTVVLLYPTAIFEQQARGDKRHNARRRNSPHRKLYKTLAWTAARKLNSPASPYAMHEVKGQGVVECGAPTN